MGWRFNTIVFGLDLEFIEFHKDAVYDDWDSSSSSLNLVPVTLAFIKYFELGSMVRVGFSFNFGLVHSTEKVTETYVTTIQQYTYTDWDDFTKLGIHAVFGNKRFSFKCSYEYAFSLMAYEFGQMHLFKAGVQILL